MTTLLPERIERLLMLYRDAAIAVGADGDGYGRMAEAGAALCAAINEIVAERDTCRKGLERSTTIEPRPWWSVFGLDRILASKMHQEAKRVGPLLMEMALQHLVDEATKRGVHPSEIRCAHREARDELMPEPNPAGGGA